MTKLRNKTKSILFVSPYPEGMAPGQRLKYEQYSDYLLAHGFSTNDIYFVTNRLWPMISLSSKFPKKSFGLFPGSSNESADHCDCRCAIASLSSTEPLFSPALLERIDARFNQTCQLRH